MGQSIWPNFHRKGHENEKIETKMKKEIERRSEGGRGEGGKGEVMLSHP